MIPLGIVNGGLGLGLSGGGASDVAKLAYTIVAAALGGAWVVITVLGGRSDGGGAVRVWVIVGQSKTVRLRRSRWEKGGGSCS